MDDFDFEYDPPADVDDEDDAEYVFEDEENDEDNVEGTGGANEEDDEMEEDEEEETYAISGQTAQIIAALFGGTGPTGITVEQLRALISSGRLRRRAIDEDDEVYDDDDDTSTPRRARWFDTDQVTTSAGEALLRSGEFGRIQPLIEKLKCAHEHDSIGSESRRKEARPPSLAQKLRDSRLSPRRVVREDLARPLYPNSNGTIVAKYDANPYSGQYSTDSSFYYTCCQDFRLHLYDTSVAPVMKGNNVSPDTSDPSHTTSMKTMKTIDGAPGRWTITDSHLSPDNERMIYSSITTTVHMTKTRDPNNEQIPLELSDRRGRYDSFGIYSCRFSADGNEVIAGGNEHLFVYDLQAMRRTVRIHAHQDDINSCCWADSSSGNVLISASDDTTLKVWDRRSLGAHSTPAGVLVGHTEGITYVAPKGDGRYVVSNGKDQTMRLWDLRKMHSDDAYEAMPRRNYGLGSGWDYRSDTYRRPRVDKHPNDCSVMRYRGHHVFRTLIRCHFSPEETTGGSYLYTGSADGRIHIYSLDGEVVQVIDRSKSLPISFDPSETEPIGTGRRPTSRYYSKGCVRDVSWHTREPVMMSVAWMANHNEGGSVARHEWKGLGRNGMKLEDVVERDRLEGVAQSAQELGDGSAPLGMPGGWDE